MAIGFILGFVFLVLLAVSIFSGIHFGARASSPTSYYDFDSQEEKRTYIKRTKAKSDVSFVGAMLSLLLFITIPFSFHQVNSGEIAVVKHMGKATNVRTAGTYFDFWITEKYEKYDSKVQSMEVVTMAYSKDAQTMDVAMTLQYQIDTSKAIQIANQYGSMKIIANRIQSIAIEKAKAVLSGYSAMNIIETRSTISPQVEKAIKEAIDEEYCVNVQTVVLTNIDFSDAFEKTVEDKMIAEQQKLKAQYEKETAIVNAEKELEVAKLAAEAKIEAAKADAQSQIEIAKAEARAIQVKSIEVARSLGFKIKETKINNEDGSTSVEYTIDFSGKSSEEIAVIADYLKYMEYLAVWNGELPYVMTDNAANIVVPIK